MKKMILITLSAFMIGSVGFTQTKYIPKSKVMKQMMKFNKALGVKCNFCHIKDKKVTIKMTDKYDMKKDFGVMRHQRVAQAMVGQTHQTNLMLKKRGQAPINCMECHQGKLTPTL
jgi:hypothetical protein